MDSDLQPRLDLLLEHKRRLTAFTSLSGELMNTRSYEYEEQQQRIAPRLNIGGGVLCFVAKR